MVLKKRFVFSLINSPKKIYMHPKLLAIEAFQYDLPDSKIAVHPLAQRDNSKLLVYSNGEIVDACFKQLDRQLPESSLLVYNQTKVVHARLLFQKETGGKVEVFCLEPDLRYADVTSAMKAKGEVYWKCLLGGASKWKEGQFLHLDTDVIKVTAKKIAAQDGTWIIRLCWEPRDMSFAEVLQEVGKVPLPPYLNREATEADKSTYQTVFAKEEGSVAAPTASLHFTPAVLQSLNAKGITMTEVTLHVGAGTFKPVKSAHMDGHEMHAEWMEVSVKTIHDLMQQLKSNNPIIPIGTTSCRTIESLYWIGLQAHYGQVVEMGSIAVSQWMPYEFKKPLLAPSLALNALKSQLEERNIDKLIVRTQIIIAPGYVFKLVSGIITNFHQPQSTLLLLVAALIGGDWQKVYQHALNHDYRFLSYGDSSLLWAAKAN
jgi:S-adenosylmethionine:tRNA ribosyltransferase-isomerase